MGMNGQPNHNPLWLIGMTVCLQAATRVQLSICGKMATVLLAPANQLLLPRSYRDADSRMQQYHTCRLPPLSHI